VLYPGTDLLLADRTLPGLPRSSTALDNATGLGSRSAEPAGERGHSRRGCAADGSCRELLTTGQSDLHRPVNPCRQSTPRWSVGSVTGPPRVRESKLASDVGRARPASERLGLPVGGPGVYRVADVTTETGVILSALRAGLPDHGWAAEATTARLDLTRLPPAVHGNTPATGPPERFDPSSESGPRGGPSTASPVEVRRRSATRHQGGIPQARRALPVERSRRGRGCVCAPRFPGGTHRSWYSPVRSENGASVPIVARNGRVSRRRVFGLFPLGVDVGNTGLFGDTAERAPAADHVHI